MSLYTIILWEILAGVCLFGAVIFVPVSRSLYGMVSVGIVLVPILTGVVFSLLQKNIRNTVLSLEALGGMVWAIVSLWPQPNEGMGALAKPFILMGLIVTTVGFMLLTAAVWGMIRNFKQGKSVWFQLVLLTLAIVALFFIFPPLPLILLHSIGVRF